MKTRVYLLAGGMLAAVLAAGWFLQSESSVPALTLSEGNHSEAIQPQADLPAAPLNRVMEDHEERPTMKLRGAFEDLPDRAVPQKDDAVLVAIPPGGNASALEVRDLDPKLRLPASLAASDPAIPLSPRQELEKQRIARDFLQEVALARAATRNPAELAAQWKTAQWNADQRMLAAVGSKAFGQQVQAINPELGEQASAIRRTAQRRMIDRHLKQLAEADPIPADSLSNPNPNDSGLPKPPRTFTKLDGEEIRRTNQRTTFERAFGQVPAWLAE
jgi:hypothetical protein